MTTDGMTVKEDVLSVPEMSCGHCVNTIEETMTHLPGVEAVSVDLPTKTVRLRYQPEQLSMNQIEAALDDAGYSIAK